MPDPELQRWAEFIFAQSDACSHEKLDDRATLIKLTEIFEHPIVYLGSLAEPQVAQAFWDLSSCAFHSLYDSLIEWDVCERFVQSFTILFRDYFAVRCEPVLGHRSQGGRLNIACYMWWDFDCWCARHDPLDRNRHDSAILASMKSILAIDHAACQESALHGLGHWYRAHPQAVEEIIDEFLQRAPNVGDELRAYASNARCGCVL